MNTAGEDAFTTELEIFQEPFFNFALNGSIEIIAGENLEVPCQEKVQLVFKNSICTTIRPSLKIWMFSVHRNKTELENFESHFAPQ